MAVDVEDIVQAQRHTKRNKFTFISKTLADFHTVREWLQTGRVLSSFT